jgi:hypothetical protein
MNLAGTLERPAGSRPAVPEAPDQALVARETIGRHHQTIKQSSASPVPCGYSLLMCSYINLRVMDRDLSSIDSVQLSAFDSSR